MKRCLPLLLVALAGCPAGTTDSGLLVTVELDNGLTSRCIQVVVRVGAAERRTGAVRLDNRRAVTVAIARGDFPEAINLQAVGFSDDACQTAADPAEVSPNASATFVAGVKNTPFRLRVSRMGPVPEVCTNGVDDNANGASDCADPACNGQPCVSSNACLAAPTCVSGVCTSATAVQCLTPPSACFDAIGTCQSGDGGCVYSPRPSAVCDDQDLCTVSDTCSTEGTCAGVPRVCNAPPNAQCFAPTGTCEADAGCRYAVTDDAGCDDQQSCTVNDRCDSTGACTGTAVVCAPHACGVFSGACNPDGGCVVTPVDAGTPCGDGGVCNDAAGCVPTWPYVPANFVATQLPTLPDGPVTLNCGETVIDTSTLPPSITNWCSGQPAINATLVPQAGEREAVLLSFNGLTIGADGGLRLVGSRPAILAVAGDAVVLGRIVAESGSRTCAAGAGATGTPSSLGNGGAGGAGFGTAGAAGGVGADISLDPGNGGAGGATNGEPLLVPLRGGCSGGRGGETTTAGAPGGGALQLTVSGQLTISGTVAAPGKGGAGGAGAIRGTGGNGGGSGGALLLEANTLLLVAAAQLTANGGGGGEGGGPAQTGNSGASGSIATATPALGGGNAALLGGRGGDGATSTADAGAGENGGSAGGGGGGGLGRIRINTVSGCNYVPGLAVLSPMPTSRLPGPGCP